MAKLEFWYEFASTYSYLAASRIEKVAAAAGAELVWRPFLLGPIFADQGWQDSPFNLYPAKGRYMWRDMARLCEDYGLPFQQPSAFPRNGLLAARVACLASAESAPWLADFTRAVYHTNFAEDAEIGDPEVIAGLLRVMGVDPDAVIERATSDENRARLRAQTERAKELGIFGAPGFTVGEELFWGNDRLGNAIAQALLGG